MIKTKAELKDYLKCERSRYLGSMSNVVYFLRLLGGFEDAILWHYQRSLRYTEYYKNTGRNIMYTFYRVKLNYLMLKTQIHISPNTCNRGLKIMHVGPIIINGRVRIGKNATIHVMTSFVAGGNNNDTPVIGDNVVIGIGSHVVGGVFLPDGIAVGAGAVVVSSFHEENITVAGVPAIKISNSGREKWGE